MIHLRLEGLTCASCVASAEDALHAVRGVTSAAVSLAEQSAFIEGDAVVNDLIAALHRAGYRASLASSIGISAESNSETLTAWNRCAPWVWLALGLVVAGLGMSEMLGWRAGSELSGWVQCALTLVLLTAAWRPVLVPGARAFLRLRPEMNALVGLGLITAFAVSAAMLLRGHFDHLHFESAALAGALVLLGRHLEGRASAASSAAFRALAAQLPATAEVLRRGERIVIPVSELRPRDLLCIRAGEAIAADGVVDSGCSSIDQAWLTGESLPLDCAPGDSVKAGSINLSGELRVRVTSAGAESMIGRIIATLRSAGRQRTAVERTCDRVAVVFTPVVLLLALGTAAAWWLAGDLAHGLECMVALLLVACPCSLGLATPAAVTVALGRAARMGLVVRDPAAFEAAAVARHVVMDKTGTLTESRHELVRVITAPGFEAAELLAVAAALESGSLHPFGAAVCAAAAKAESCPTNSDRVALSATAVHTVAGMGVEGFVAGQRWRCGRGAWARGAAAALPQALCAAEAELRESGCGLAWLQRNSETVGLLAFRAPLRSDAPPAVAALRRAGLEVHIFSGDHAAAVQATATAAGITAAHADLSPEEKLRALGALRGGSIMVGDGINDAPALASATVGFAVHGATDVARAAGNVIALRPALTLVPEFVGLARAVRRVIRQNLAGAFAYNILAMPAAMGLLGFTLPPSVAALAMSASCLFLLGNSLRLARWSRR